MTFFVPRRSHHLRRASFTDRSYERQLRKAKSEHWSSLRLAFAKVILSPNFDPLTAAVVMLQFLLVIHQTDSESDNGVMPGWFGVSEILFLVFYTVELSARIFVWRCTFFASKMNIFDTIIVSLDVVITCLARVHFNNLPSISILRLARGVKLLRVSRVLIKFRELYFIMHALVHALRSVLWAVLILVLVLTIWSVLAVQTIHPLVTEMAERGELGDSIALEHAFKTVMRANLTLFTLVLVGDGWHDVAVPVVERHPWTIAIFGSLYAFIHLCVMNLVITVIVDTALEAREHDMEHKLFEKANDHARAVEQLSKICDEMDDDKNGYLTKDELNRGFEDNQDMRDIFESMDIGADDIDVLFDVLDHKHTGSVSHNEFVEQLHKMKTQDSHTLLIFIKSHLNHVRQDVESQLHLLKDDLLATVQSDHSILSCLSERSSMGPASDAPDGRNASPKKILKDLTSTGSLSQVMLNAAAACGRNDPATSLVAGNASHEQANLKLFQNATDKNFQQPLQESLDMMLQDALKRAQDQTTALRGNCEIMCSFNESLANVLTKCSRFTLETGLDCHPSQKGYETLLQEAFQKVEDQITALRWNCEIMRSFNESLDDVITESHHVVSKLSLPPKKSMALDTAKQHDQFRVSMHRGSRLFKLDRLQL